MVYVIRKEHFNAAHRLFNPNWTDEKNLEVYGPCANNNWHGHNFELIVTVKGKPNPETGFVYDLKKLGDLIKKEIIDRLVMWGLCHWRKIEVFDVAECRSIWRFALIVNKVKATDYTGVKNK